MIRVEQSGYVGRRNIESKLWDCGKKGIAAVNMRTVASECGIALGSLYNYFSSKSELLSATIEAVWKDIFQMGKTLEKCENIVEYLNLLFEGVENSRSRYPKFFSMHALGFTAGERQEGKKAMEVYFLRLKIKWHIFWKMMKKYVKGYLQKI
ncbi:TetR/AcrR family transcriptional regulator [[Ruminococcus] torques]|nr:TetR/AcrR family transcriptional regulator [[Ruminococcus] torques]